MVDEDLAERANDDRWRAEGDPSECSVSVCSRQMVARTFCFAHYKQFRASGFEVRPTKAITPRYPEGFACPGCGWKPYEQRQEEQE